MKIEVASSNLGGAHTWTLEGVSDNCVDEIHGSRKGVDMVFTHDDLGGTDAQPDMILTHM